MGRKKDLNELGKRGPGRKAKKQQPPELPVRLKEKDSIGIKKLGGRIRQRSKRRAVKLAAKVMQAEQKRNGKKKLFKATDVEEMRIESSKQEERPESPEDLQPLVFSDENLSWLRPVDNKEVHARNLLSEDDGSLEKSTGTYISV